MVRDNSLMYMPMTETHPVLKPLKNEEDGSSIDSREMIIKQNSETTLDSETHLIFEESKNPSCCDRQ
jgi:hypothetical protein